jgi:hypothetical protein
MLREYERITIRRPAPCALQCEEWVFYLTGSAIRLTAYTQEQRPSIRHKWRIAHSWSSGGGRNHDLSGADVPLPDDVSTEAKAIVIAHIVVIR